MNSTVQKSLLYILMPLFWLVLLVIFLYSPYAEQFLSRYHKSITIFVWSDIVDSTVIKNFERETGIKVLDLMKDLRNNMKILCAIVVG